MRGFKGWGGLVVVDAEVLDVIFWRFRVDIGYRETGLSASLLVIILVALQFCVFFSWILCLPVLDSPCPSSICSRSRTCIVGFGFFGFLFGVTELLAIHTLSMRGRLPFVLSCCSNSLRNLFQHVCHPQPLVLPSPSSLYCCSVCLSCLV